MYNTITSSSFNRGDNNNQKKKKEYEITKIHGINNTYNETQKCQSRLLYQKPRRKKRRNFYNKKERRRVFLFILKKKEAKQYIKFVQVI